MSSPLPRRRDDLDPDPCCCHGNFPRMELEMVWLEALFMGRLTQRKIRAGSSQRLRKPRAMMNPSFFESSSSSSSPSSSSPLPSPLPLPSTETDTKTETKTSSLTTKPPLTATKSSSIATPSLLSSITSSSYHSVSESSFHSMLPSASSSFHSMLPSASSSFHSMLPSSFHSLLPSSSSSFNSLLPSSDHLLSSSLSPTSLTSSFSSSSADADTGFDAMVVDSDNNEIPMIMFRPPTESFKLDNGMWGMRDVATVPTMETEMVARQKEPCKSI